MTALYRLLQKLLMLTVDLFRILARIHHNTTTLIHQGATNMAKIEDLQAAVTQIATDQTANAAAAIATTYVSARGNGTVTLTHTNDAQTDKIFTYLVIG